MQDTDLADDAENLPCSPEGSPMGQHYRQSGNFIIVGSLPMNHWTWLDEGPASFVINVPARSIKIA